jgi:hypothetical protein
VLLAVALVGCAADTDAARGGEVAAGVAATPVYVALKAPICATSLVMAAGVGALASLAPNRRERTMRDLGEGVGHTCGPPWTAIPARAALP